MANYLEREKREERSGEAEQDKHATASCAGLNPIMELWLEKFAISCQVAKAASPKGIKDCCRTS